MEDLSSGGRAVYYPMAVWVVDCYSRNKILITKTHSATLAGMSKAACIKFFRENSKLLNKLLEIIKNTYNLAGFKLNISRNIIIFFWQKVTSSLVVNSSQMVGRMLQK